MVRRVASLLLVTLLIGAAIVGRVSGGPFAHAAANGKSGDIKISQFPSPSQGLQGNEPHVPCGFYILGSNFSAAQGNVTVYAWSAKGNGSAVVNGTFSGTVDNAGNYQFVNGPYYLNAGHYTSDVTSNKGAEIAKQKSFWVDGPCSPPPPPCVSSTMCGSAQHLTVSHRSMNLAGTHWSRAVTSRQG
jgi:hypothetical protein